MRLVLALSVLVLHLAPGLGRARHPPAPRDDVTDGSLLTNHELTDLLVPLLNKLDARHTPRDLQKKRLVEIMSLPHKGKTRKGQAPLILLASELPVRNKNKFRGYPKESDEEMAELERSHHKKKKKHHKRKYHKDHPKHHHKNTTSEESESDEYKHKKKHKKHKHHDSSSSSSEEHDKDKDKSDDKKPSEDKNKSKEDKTDNGTDDKKPSDNTKNSKEDKNDKSKDYKKPSHNKNNSMEDKNYNEKDNKKPPDNKKNSKEDTNDKGEDDKKPSNNENNSKEDKNDKGKDDKKPLDIKKNSKEDTNDKGKDDKKPSENINPSKKDKNDKDKISSENKESSKEDKESSKEKKNSAENKNDANKDNSDKPKPSTNKPVPEEHEKPKADSHSDKTNSSNQPARRKATANEEITSVDMDEDTSQSVVSSEQNSKENGQNEPIGYESENTSESVYEAQLQDSESVELQHPVVVDNDAAYYNDDSTNSVDEAHHDYTKEYGDAVSIDNAINAAVVGNQHHPDVNSWLKSDTKGHIVSSKQGSQVISNVDSSVDYLSPHDKVKDSVELAFRSPLSQNSDSRVAAEVSQESVYESAGFYDNVDKNNSENAVLLPSSVQSNIDLLDGQPAETSVESFIEVLDRDGAKDDAIPAPGFGYVYRNANKGDVNESHKTYKLSFRFNK